MKKLLIALALVSANAMAYVPQAPNSPTGYDEFRTADGASCRSSVGGNLQLYGGGYDTNGDSDSYYSNGDETGFHVGVAYSFGGGKRIDCSRLQEIETERAELELQKLREEVKMLKQIRELQLGEQGGGLPPIMSK